MIDLHIDYVESKSISYIFMLRAKEQILQKLICFQKFPLYYNYLIESVLLNCYRPLRQSKLSGSFAYALSVACTIYCTPARCLVPFDTTTGHDLSLGCFSRQLAENHCTQQAVSGKIAPVASPRDAARRPAACMKIGKARSIGVDDACSLAG